VIRRLFGTHGYESLPSRASTSRALQVTLDSYRTQPLVWEARKNARGAGVELLLKELCRWLDAQGPLSVLRLVSNVMPKRCASPFQEPICPKWNGSLDAQPRRCPHANCASQKWQRTRLLVSVGSLPVLRLN